MSNIDAIGARPTMLAAIQRTQSELDRATTESGSGRYADVGLQLGGRTRESVDLRNAMSAAQTYSDIASALDSRLSQADNALSAVSTATQTARNSILSALNTGDGSSAETAAQSAFSSVASALNTKFGEVYLFSGQKTDTAALSGSPVAGAAATAISDAFQATFGVAPGSAGAASITSSQMQDFLDNQFSDLFKDPNWGTLWSQADNSAQKVTIGAGLSVNATTSANDEGVRNIVKGLAMASALGLSSLSADARNTVMQSAASALSAGDDGVTQMRANIGSVQSQATSAKDAMDAQKTTLETRIGDLEGVDPAEVALRLSQLTTQLESSYTMTSRLSKLTLANYI